MTAKDRARRLFKRISAGYALPTVNEIAEALLAAEREGMEKAAKIVESNISDEFPGDDMSRQCELLAAEIRKLMEAE